MSTLIGKTQGNFYSSLGEIRVPIHIQKVLKNLAVPFPCATGGALVATNNKYRGYFNNDHDHQAHQTSSRASGIYGFNMGI